MATVVQGKEGETGFDQGHQGQEMNTPRLIGTDRVGHVDVGDGAVMSVPLPGWLWQLRYVRSEPDRGKTICDDRMLAAGVLESYLYLIQECTKDEAWRRIKIMRNALRLVSIKGDEGE